MRAQVPRQSLWLLSSRPITLSSQSFPTFSTPFPRRFSSTRPSAGHNRIYQSIRSPTDLDTLLLSSTSSSTPLITLFTASWCPSCKHVLPLVQRLIERDGVGEDKGGLGFAEIEFDAPGNEELGMRYMVRSLPTLLAFSRGEPQLETKVARVEDLKDERFLVEWLEREAGRRGEGGAGGGAGLLGKLFGKS